MAPNGVPVVPGRQPVHHLQRRVLDHVGHDLGGDLLDHHDTFAVGSDLGQQGREQLHRGCGRAVGHVFQQPVRFLDQQDVLEAGHDPGLVAYPQVLDDADQHRTHQERLVLVVGDGLELEHDVASQQAADVERMTALEEPAGRAAAQAPDSDVDEAPDVGRYFLAVADAVHHVASRRLQLTQGRVARPDELGGLVVPETGLGRGPQLPGDQVPAGAGVAPQQRLGQDLGKRLVCLERGEEQGAHQVGVALQRESRLGLQWVERGGRAAQVSRADGQDAAAGPSRAAIRAYSALAGSTTSQGTGRGARASVSSRLREVWDFPEPVAPQTNACRLRVS